MVVPVIKKGVGKELEKYRGITLESMSYKVCAKTLRKRLAREVENKGIIPQFVGFQEGDGNDRLNYLVGRNLRRKKGKA